MRARIWMGDDSAPAFGRWRGREEESSSWHAQASVGSAAWAMGLLAVVVFIAFGVVAPSASAFEYLCGGEAILTSGNCKVTSVNLETFLLEDMGVPASIECPVEDVTSAGSILSATESETSAVNFKEEGKACKPAAKAINLKEEEKTNECEKVEKIEAIGLPWKSKLEEEESGLWWALIKTVKAGYKMRCKTAIGSVSDECIANEAHAPLVLVEDLAEEEGGILLLSIFFVKTLLAASEAMKCSVGGAESGLVIGEELLTATDTCGAASLEIGGGGGGGGGACANPRITVKPASANFGELDIALDESENEQFIFKNEGPGEWHPEAEGLLTVELKEPAGAKDSFTYLPVVPADCQSTPAVGEGGTCPVAVELYPHVVGDYLLEFEFPISPTVAVSGEGVK